MAGSKAYPSTTNDYQAEDDHRTLMRSAEVMGDKIRMKGVMAHVAKKEKAEKRLDQMLAAHRKGGRFK